MRAALRHFLGVDLHERRLDAQDLWRINIERRLDERNEEMKITLLEINGAIERLYALLENLQSEREGFVAVMVDAVKTTIQAGQRE